MALSLTNELILPVGIGSSLSLEHTEWTIGCWAFTLYHYPSSDGSFCKGDLESYPGHLDSYERYWKLQGRDFDSWKLRSNWCKPSKSGETEDGLVQIVLSQLKIKIKLGPSLYSFYSFPIVETLPMTITLLQPRLRVPGLDSTQQHHHLLTFLEFARICYIHTKTRKFFPSATNLLSLCYYTRRIDSLCCYTKELIGWQHTTDQNDFFLKIRTVGTLITHEWKCSYRNDF